MKPETEKALAAILEGHSHRSAYALLQRDGVPADRAQEAVTEAGQRAPAIRHRLKSLGESFTPSGCCDYCGAGLAAKFLPGQRMRWQKPHVLTGWKGQGHDGWAYICPRCRQTIAPGVLASSMAALAWTAPVVALAGALDFLTKETGGLPWLSLAENSLLLFLIFLALFVKHYRKGGYRGFPVNEGIALRSIGGKQRENLVGRPFIVLLFIVLTNIGCQKILVPSHNFKSQAASTTLAALVLSLICVPIRLHQKKWLSASPKSTWTKLAFQATPEPNCPEYLSRELINLLVAGHRRSEAREQLSQVGATPTSLKAIFSEVEGHIPFYRAAREHMAQGSQCDFCDAQFQPKMPEKIDWIFLRRSILPPYFASIESTETETLTGYHLLCERCQWSIHGPGANLWAYAGAAGALIALLIALLFDPNIHASPNLFPLVVGFIAFSWVTGVFYGERCRYRGYPANEQFSPEGVLSRGNGAGFLGATFVVGIVLCSFYLSWEAHPALKSSLLIALIGLLGYLFWRSLQPPARKSRPPKS